MDRTTVVCVTHAQTQTKIFLEPTVRVLMRIRYRYRNAHMLMQELYRL